MNYHDIKKDDMLNGTGVRVVLFVSGCKHACYSCHNPETWNPSSGILFDDDAKNEIFKELSKNYVSGITLSGGDPLHEQNLIDVYELIKEVKEKYPDKNIWLYTGFSWAECFPEVVTNEVDLIRGIRQSIIRLCDVIVDGKFDVSLLNENYPYAGSTNQKVIRVKDKI